MRVAIYSRVSTADRGQDVENQLAQIRELAQRRGWEVVAEYSDQVSAGGTKRRPNFERMMADARLRKFDLLMFWALDRLSREGALETLKYLETLTSYGVGWLSLTEQYLDSTGVFRDAVIAILAVVAKQERIRISERVKAGLDRARAKGKRLGAETRIDRAAVLELRSQGLSYPQIAAELGISQQSAFRLSKTA